MRVRVPPPPPCWSLEARGVPGPKLADVASIEGVVRYRRRKSHRGGSTVRLLVECADYHVWITWPEDAPQTARPGDTVTADVELTDGGKIGTYSGRRVRNPRRIAREHEQRDRDLFR